MTFRFGTERMRLLADVVHQGTTQSLVRRKGNGNTLAHADGPEIPPDEARRLLDGADETVFRELFGLDTSLLRSGGRDLIRSQGRLGQVLFAAGGGMGRVRDLLTDLERKRDDLGKATARHRSRPLWNALSNWEQGNADLRRTALRPDGWSALERQAQEAARTLETLLTEQAEEARERDRLRTIGACRPWLDRLRTAQQILTEAADAPDLDETFEKRWRDALENRVKSASSAEAAKTELRAAQDARAALTFDPAWIAAETDIATLADLRGRALGAETDLPKVQRDLAADLAKAAASRRDLGWDDAFPLPPAQVVKDAQRRLQQHPKLALEAASAQDRLAEADRQLAATLAELETLPGQGDLAPVADLATLLRAGGDPAARLDTARRKLRDAEAALRTALSAIPDCKLAEATLGTTAAPSEARLDAAGKALSRTETAHERAAQTHADRLAAIETERSETGRAGTHGDAARARRPGQRPRPPRRPVGATVHANPDATPTPPPPWPWTGRSATPTPSPTPSSPTARTSPPPPPCAVGWPRWKPTSPRTPPPKPRPQPPWRTPATTCWPSPRTAGGNAGDVSTLRAFLRARETAVAARDARDTAAADLADIEKILTTLGTRLAAAMNVDNARSGRAEHPAGRGGPPDRGRPRSRRPSQDVDRSGRQATRGVRDRRRRRDQGRTGAGPMDRTMAAGRRGTGASRRRKPSPRQPTPWRGSRTCAPPNTAPAKPSAASATCRRRSRC